MAPGEVRCAWRVTNASWAPIWESIAICRMARRFGYMPGATRCGNRRGGRDALGATADIGSGSARQPPSERAEHLETHGLHQMRVESDFPRAKDVRLALAARQGDQKRPP